jgi:hypothetical protein
VVVGAEWESHPSLHYGGPEYAWRGVNRAIADRVIFPACFMHRRVRDFRGMQSAMFDVLVIANRVGCWGARVRVSE